MKLKELYLKYRELVNYLICGALTTVVSLAAYYACVCTVLDPTSAVQLQAANVISWVFAVAFAYFSNRKYVFMSKNANIAREAASFVAARFGSLLLDMGCMFLFVTVCRFNDKAAKLAVQVIIVIVNYVASKLLVFKGTDGTDGANNTDNADSTDK